MKNKKVKKILHSCLDELEVLTKSIERVSVSEQSSQYFRKYALLRAIGSIETSCRLILTESLTEGQSSESKTLIKQKVRELTPDMRFGSIAKLLREFDERWCARFNEKILSHDNLQLIVALSTLTDAREDFARGQNPHVEVGATLIFFKNAMLVIKILDEVVTYDYDKISKIKYDKVHNRFTVLQSFRFS